LDRRGERLRVALDLLAHHLRAVRRAIVVSGISLVLGVPLFLLYISN